MEDVVLVCLEDFTQSVSPFSFPFSSGLRNTRLQCPVLSLSFYATLACNGDFHETPQSQAWRSITEGGRALDRGVEKQYIPFLSLMLQLDS